MQLKLAIAALAALLSVGLASSAMADTPPAVNQPNNPSAAARPVNQEKFAERKQEILNKMEQRKACIANAQTPADMRNCHKGDENHRMERREGGGNPQGEQPQPR